VFCFREKMLRQVTTQSKKFSVTLKAAALSNPVPVDKGEKEFQITDGTPMMADSPEWRPTKST